MARVRRVLVLLAAAGLGLFLALLLAIHTPWARSWALTRAAGFLQRYDLVLRADGLGYNLLTRRVTLVNARLAAAGHEARPFFTATRVEVRLPWQVYRGRFAIDHLEIAGAQVDIYRDERSVVNLPPGSGAPPPERPRRLRLGGLTIRDLRFEYADAARVWSVALPRIEAALSSSDSGSSGGLASRQPLQFRRRDRTMTVAPFETGITFDGMNVELEGIAINAAEMNARIGGSLTRVLDALAIDLSLAGTVDVEQAVGWVPPPPVPVSGPAAIDGSITGTLDEMVVDLRVHSTALAVGREHGLDLSGALRVTNDALTSDRLAIAPESGGEIRARVTLPWSTSAASTVAAEWTSVDAQAALRLVNLDRQAIGAAFTGSGEFSFAEPRSFAIRTRATGRAGRGVVPVSGTIAATVVGDEYRYEPDLQLPGVALSGQVGGQLSDQAAALSSLTGSLRARVSDVAGASTTIATLGFPVADVMRDVHGAVEAPLTLSGTYRDPHVETTATADALVVPVLGQVRASAHVVASTRRAQISRIEVDRAATRITGEVGADISKRLWSGKLRAVSPQAETLQDQVPDGWRLHGPVAAEATLGGTFDNIRLNTVIAGQALTWAEQPIDRATVHAVVTTDAIEVSSLDLRQGEGMVTGRLRYAWADGAYDASITGDRLSWRSAPDGIGATYALQFDGTGTVDRPGGKARLDFTLDGGDASGVSGGGHAVVDLTGDEVRIAIPALSAAIGGVPVSIEAPITLTRRNETFTLIDTTARVGSGRLTASGQWRTGTDGNVRARFAGDLNDLIKMGSALGIPADLGGRGAVTLDLQSNGTRDGTTASVSVTSGALTWGKATPVIDQLTVAAALQGSALTVSRVAGQVGVGGVAGGFSATATATVPAWTVADIDGALVLDTARLTFSGIPVGQTRPSLVTLADGIVSIADAAWTVAENPVTIGGTVGVAAEDPALDLAVAGPIDLRVLSAFITAVAFDGLANLDTRVTGTVSAPRLTGRIVLDDAEVALAEPRLVLSELSGPIELDGNQARFNGVRGLVNGGGLSLDGALTIDGGMVSGGALSIQAQAAALELARGLRSEVNALVVFRPDPKNPSLSGDIRVVQSAYTDTMTLAALARQAAAQPLPTGAAERPYLDRLQLNLSLSTTLDLVVDNNYGRLAAGASLRLVGTVAEPGVEGRVTLREDGQIYLAGRTFRITRGDVSFTDRRRIHPEFNIAAEARLPGTGTVTMTLTGTLDRPSIDLTSEEGSSTPGEIAAQIVGASSSEAALALLTADLLGVTGRAIGLDALRVDRGAVDDNDFRDYREDPSVIGASRTDPTTRLTIGKRLSDQVEFTVSQNLHESGKATFVVSYFPRRNVELRGISRDSATLGLGVRHQVTFGSGSADTPSERRVRPVISDVDFVEVEPDVEAVARRQSRLSRGDTFDFLDLQRDADRIRSALLTGGYYEARVRTRRIDSDDGRSVVVEYRINRGPQTVLQVVGFTPPPALLAELTDAWHRNIFDQFLIDDLTHRVRRYLVASGELGSIVVGRVDRPSTSMKRLVIEVTTGVSVSGREIRFVGNQQIETGRLRNEIAEAGVALESWLDRSVVERLLRQVYVEHGFLRATVTGRPLTIDGDTGVLAFDITEGAQAQVASVAWTGVADARMADVKAAAELTTPSPYVAAELNAARRRIEDHYRRLGFNRIEVDLQASVDGQSVALTVAVTEGTQDVLRSVEMSGREVTQGQVLTEAMRFELGQPVNLDTWALARKRLYDTNVFRLVDIQAVPAGDAVNGVQPVTALVTVQEYPQWSLRYGVQLEGDRTLELGEFTSTRNLGGVAELKNPNLFGRALTFGLSGLYEYDRRDATVFLGTSRLFGWRARSNLYGFVARERLRDDAGDAVVAIVDRQGVSADQRWRVGRFQVVYGYSYEHNRTYDPDPSPQDPLPLDFRASLAQVSGATFLDRRNDPINPRRGTFSSVSLDHAASWLGSDVSNWKVLAQQFVFVPVGPVVLASRAQAGGAFGRDILLPSDRFTAGGATTVRGYGEGSLGPRDALGVPVGGDTLVVLNQEARFPIYRWARGVAFVDAGNIFGRGESFDLGQLKVGYGVGLRLDSPVGLLRADVGFAATSLPTRRTQSADRVRWYFGFGHIF